MIRIAALSLPLLIAAVPAAAQKEPVKRPDAFEKLVNCRSIADATARLACYDTQVERLDAAERSSEVVVLDKAAVKKARRGLFGFTIPDLGIFGGRRDGGEEEKEEITEIETTVKSVTVNRFGKLTWTIEDGARWVQTDSMTIRPPKPGMAITIRRAALGSYFAKFDGRPAIRAKREN